MAVGGAGLPHGSEPPPPGPLPPTQPAGINWRFARTRAIAAAALLVLLTLAPVTGALFLIWIPLCGGLTVFLYQRRFPATPISSGVGARMGLGAGAAAFVALTIISAIDALVEHFVQHHSVLATLRTQIVAEIKTNPNPQAAQALQFVNSDGGLMALVVIGCIVVLVLFLALSAVGGAIQSRIVKPTGAR